MRLVNSITRSHAFMFTSSSVLCRTIQFIKPAGSKQPGVLGVTSKIMACNKLGTVDSQCWRAEGRSKERNIDVSEH